MSEAAGLAVGDEVEVPVGPVAHGGHCVARYGPDGQVVFVRHAIPGERVRARVTEVGPKGRYVRADAVAVLEASADRVARPCPFSGPGRCGGCDWQHVSLEAQRRLKMQVVAEQLVRLGGFTPEEVQALGVTCEPVPGDQDGLRWRTRVEFAVARDGGDGAGSPAADVVGLRVHRSHEVVPIDDCLIATEGVLGTGALRQPPPPSVVALDAVDPSVSEAALVPLALIQEGRGGRGKAGGPQRGRRGAGSRGARLGLRPLGKVPEVTERVRTQAGGSHDFTLSARGFWQVHPGAAATFTEQVLTWLAPREGERVLDLYSGVGLFAVPLAQAVGPRGSVLAVEADRGAAGAACRHLAAYPWAGAVARPTAPALAELVAQGERADLVVLDPPRTGAGREVMEAIADLRPRAVVYVACDPAALARDLATARELGLELGGLRVLDAFPMTQHMECLALLV
ncbi:class I SAM-dependent RNA methyltransferase [Ornithinimicrobium pratense]|uniref:Class I SAM-dependent RNA methyltransferase n=1 Tax=Ornithinimicrobium pratense TaxID=2593973 RepID=A0A5J6V3P0_9MICO|nr:TRAM domain-containing protein [Ornithinimicrobium pratense]QFG68335.1 class I SAM-dependent RNA methyltransferase [Ornithinimicrobium pratense]